MTNEMAAIVIEAAKTIAEMSPGTVVGHLQMETLVGEHRNGPRKSRFYGMVRHVRDYLRGAHGIFLRSLPRIGYQLIEPGKEIDSTHGAFVRGARVMGRAVAHTQLIRIQNIDDMALRAQTLDKSAKMANIYGMLQNGLESIDTWKDRDYARLES